MIMNSSDVPVTWILQCDSDAHQHQSCEWKSMFTQTHKDVHVKLKSEDKFFNKLFICNLFLKATLLTR